MAGKGGSLLGKLLGALKGIFNKIPSYIADCTVSDINVEVDNGIYKSITKLTSDKIKTNNGQPLQLEVGIAAKNVNDSELYKTCINGLTEAESANAFDGNNANIANAVKTLLGIDISSKSDDQSTTNNPQEPSDPKPGSVSFNNEGVPLDPDLGFGATGISDNLSAICCAEQSSDRISSANAQPDSLLAPIDINAKLPKVWQDFMQTGIVYDLRCQCPGYSAGWVTDKPYNQIITMIAYYPVTCGASSQTVNPYDTQGTYGNGQAGTEGEFKVNPTNLVLPIVLAIQEYLKNYFDSVCNEIYGDQQESQEQPQDDNSQDTDDQDTENNQEETNADNVAENTETTEGEPTPQMNSKMINMKLQKITGSTDIDLMAIQANFNPGEALTVVDDVLSSPDFFDLITETPQSYEVLVDDEGYDVNPCTDLIVDPNENLTQLFIQANQFSRNLHMIHWLSIGNDMEKLHIKAEELYGELDQEIDLLAELIVEKTGTIIDINKIETWNTVGTQDKTFQQGIECIKQDAQSFIDYIDITYPNQPSDVQSILDDWLRYWNKQINYFITREQEI